MSDRAVDDDDDTVPETRRRFGWRRPYCSWPASASASASA